ncbi:MAG: ABC transporter ATP-binding protein [Planctomycetes bacterium]|nr:ABC transporter ATP-binding protein [Planctomycetota bacterium]MCB9919410.1 ABC transporter ATP-binding protein [Planctomycetota bacterium]
MSGAGLQPALAFSRVSLWYGNVLGVSDISFSIQSGVVGLLGMNGAGKSTMMKLASGMIRPSIGSVEVFGKPPQESTEIRNRIGLCPDMDRFYERMSAHAWVTFMARLAGVPSAKQKAAEVLDRLDMSDRMHKKIGGYSKGMRQRTKLARALVVGADLLLLDEPLNGLDPIGRHAMIRLVRELGDEGKAVLVSSHVLHEVEAMTDRLLLLHQGRILAEGKVHEIRDQLSERALQVEVRVREPRSLARQLIGATHVAGVDVEKDRVVARVADAGLFFDQITDLGCDERYGIEAIVPLDADLESVFGYLVRK